MHSHVPERICLIIPPSIFLLDERVFPSLGILKIAANLERAGTKVELVDLSGVTNFEEAMSDHAANSKCEIFGITATTPLMPATAKVARAIRSVRSNVRIILGGPHITLVNAAYKKEVRNGTPGRAVRAMRQAEEMFDVLVAGDGEEAIFVACEPNTPKLVDADGPKPKAEEVELGRELYHTNKKLNELPFPARHLIDMSSYHYFIDGVPATSLIAQLGCPFPCGFCGGRDSPMLRRVRTRTSENIVEEMEHIWRTYCLCGLMLYDDELNVNKDVVKLMNLIEQKQKDLGVVWRLRGFIKSQLFTDEQADAMYRAGFRWILTGFESGSPRILENIQKKATREQNSQCMEIAKRHGLKVKALMSLGHPGESKETAQETLDWLLEAKPDDFDVSIITSYAGTPYYDEAVPHPELPNVWTYTYNKTGDRLHQIEVDYTTTADYYKGDPDGGYKAYVFTDHLSAEDLVSERDRIERTVREKLGISFNHATPAMRYEHSMGQSGLPARILRTSH